MPIWKFEIKSPDPSIRLDKLLLEASESGLGNRSEILQPLSRTRIQSLIEEGCVKINGITANSKSKVKVNNQLEVSIPDAKSMDVLAENSPLEILFQDVHVAVINKPPGVSTHPSTHETSGTLVNRLLHHLDQLSGIGGEIRPGIVHRLDKFTSGALVVTKTDAAHHALSEKFAKHDLTRKYWALCYGTLKKNSLRYETLIGRNPKDRKKMSTQVSEGRKAISEFRLLQEFSVLKKSDGKMHPFASWIEATLYTGRTHQVRVHLTELGSSLLGDKTYGTPTSEQLKWKLLPKEIQECVQKLPGQALHAQFLGFQHPITGENLEFKAEPPAHFTQLLEVLKKYAE